MCKREGGEGQRGREKVLHSVSVLVCVGDQIEMKKTSHSLGVPAAGAAGEVGNLRSPGNPGWLAGEAQ